MRVLAKPTRWSYLVQYQSCQAHFIIDGDLIWRLTYVGVPSDPQRAELNRHIVQEHQYTTAYLALEYWLREHPHEPYQEGAGMQGVYTHEATMENNRQRTGISRLEERKGNG